MKRYFAAIAVLIVAIFHVGEAVRTSARAKGGVLGPQEDQERLLQNQLFGVQVDRNCMRDVLDRPNACAVGGPDCGKCVRVLAECNPDPAPVAVYPDCMRKCLDAREDCTMCVDIHADCAFGQ